MNRPTMLLLVLVKEILDQAGLAAERDVEVILRRVEHEGYAFLSQTLPTLCDGLEAGIERGRLYRSDLPSFGSHKRGILPNFLKGLFLRVFKSDGYLSDDVCADAIYGIRQISRFYKKPFVTCTNPIKLAKAEKSYVKTDEELPGFAGYTNVEPSELHRSRRDNIRSRTRSVESQLCSISQTLFKEMFKGAQGISEIVPCDGPGATAERGRAKLTRNARRTLQSWPSRGSEEFPLDVYGIPNWGNHCDLEGVQILSCDEELPVRVVFVPKTEKVPRVIAVEPHYMMRRQQSVMQFMVTRLESHPNTAGLVNFTDQTVNQEMARIASINGQYATMDLSEASDRVSLELARLVLGGTDIWPYLKSSRTGKATTPSGILLTLKKFASMGSATCFPVESCVFFALCVLGLLRYYGVDHNPSPEIIRRISRKIRVYGDDLIVPTGAVYQVKEVLEAFSLRVNATKTFSSSHFRESCGGDFYDGVSVKPVYCRRDLRPSNALKNADVAMSLASTSDQFYELGLWKTSQTIRDMLCQAWGNVPRSRRAIAGLGFKSVLFDTNLKWDSHLNGYSQRRVVFVPQDKPDVISTLSGFLLKAFKETGMDEKSSSHSSVNRGVFKPKRRWILAHS